MSEDMKKHDVSGGRSAGSVNSVQNSSVHDGDDIQIFEVNSNTADSDAGRSGSHPDSRSGSSSGGQYIGNSGSQYRGRPGSSSGRYLQKAGKRQQKSGRKKKILIAVCIAGAACVCGVLLWKHFHPSMDAGMDYANMSYPETVVRTDIQSTYSTTGIVISSAQSEAAAQSSGDTAYPVEEVNVKVGDQVKAGDVLYTLDMSDVENDLELQKEKMALQQQSNAIDQGTADRQVAVQQGTSAQMYNDETRHLQDKADDTDKELQNQAQLQTQLAQQQAAEASAKAALDSAQATYDDIHQQYLDAQEEKTDADADKQKADNNLSEITSRFSDQTENNSDQNTDNDGEQNSSQAGTFSADYRDTQEYKDAIQKVNDAEERLIEAQQKSSDLSTQDTEASAVLTQAQTDYDKAVSDRKATEDALKAKKDDVETNVRALEEQGSTTLTDNRTQNEAEDAAQDAAAKQRVASAQALVDMEDAIRRAQQKLENGQVKAAIDGTVTAVNVKPGQVYSGSNAVVINNLDDLKISTDIDEAHIADLKVGQKVNITTDSTGTQVLSGTVSYTAAAPNASDDSAAGSTSSVNTSGNTNTGTSSTSTVAARNKPMYHVEITLDEPSERLRMGMNAKLEFITAEAKNVLAVPTTCLMDDGMGGYYVLPYHDTSADGSAEDGAGTDYGTGSGSAEGSFDGAYLETQIVVTTGIHDDYYTEITSDNLQEGELIEGAPAGSSSVSADASSMMEGVY